MPQSRLECSRALADRLDGAALFAELHDILVAELDAGLGACKSRIAVVEQIRLADGAVPRELAALEIAIIAGRSDAAKKRAGERILSLLSRHLAPVIAECEVHLSVLLVDMAPTNYFKTVTSQHAG